VVGLKSLRLGNTRLDLNQAERPKELAYNGVKTICSAHLRPAQHSQW
jgi:hypothetical protein